MVDLNFLVLAVAAILFVIAIGALMVWAFRAFFSGHSGAQGFLRPRDKRLGVVETAPVDARRKLLLVRRDDVEHLILTGGPVDVLLETGIQSRLGSLNGMGEAVARGDNELDNGRAFPAVDDRLSLQHDQST
jgi:hypothetical protein